jgi:hypothetical protein
MKNKRTAFVIFIIGAKDKANQYTGIKKNEKGKRKSCMVDFCIKRNYRFKMLFINAIPAFAGMTCESVYCSQSAFA